MTEDQTLIRTICEDAFVPLRAASLAGSETYHCFDIDCAVLEDFSEINIYDAESYKPMFDTLNAFQCPVLYWFEISSATATSEIVKAINSYKRRGIRKATPAVHKNPYLNTTVLYVGKVKKGFSGRLVTHLGYYKVTRTQGLQLFHWSKELQLSLKLHVYTFKPEMAPLMTVVERGVADRLRPLLGKHR